MCVEPGIFYGFLTFSYIYLKITLALMHRHLLHLDQVQWKIDFPHGAGGFGPRHTDAVVSVWKPQQQQQQPWKTGCALNDSCFFFFFIIYIPLQIKFFIFR